MRPVRVHLDTSDYAEMYRAEPGSPQAQTRDQLKNLVESGRLQIGLSYHVVFELLQKAEPKYREDRLKRARLLKRICGCNALPFPSDLGQGYRFSLDGLWIPRIDAEEFEIERVVQIVIKAVVSPLPRHERRALSKRSVFVDWLKRRSGGVSLPWPFVFGRGFSESGDLRNYLLGQITRSEANTRLRFYITDPEIVYKTWFEEYGKENPVFERRDKLTENITKTLVGLHDMIEENYKLQRDVKSALAARGNDALTPEGREKILSLKREISQFSNEITSAEELNERVPAWRVAVGEESGLLAAQILYAFHSRRRAILRSDSIDFVHAMYLPHVDLWRGDKAFCSLLVNSKVNFHDRVVPTLSALSERIETEITKHSK